MRLYVFFFFNDTATTEIYTLSLHDALPIFLVDAEAIFAHVLKPQRDGRPNPNAGEDHAGHKGPVPLLDVGLDRKSTRLNSSHANISYAVFCLKKKTRNNGGFAPQS